MQFVRLFIGLILGSALTVAAPALAREIHVATTGDDAHDGSAEHPLRTISAAAALAQPGDAVTVHEGLYRERITPPRGGTSDDQRITYHSAPGEQVEIRGSEVLTGWEEVEHDTWKATVPNTFFGDYNPFADSIHGDWFNPKGRPHHTGAVYIDGRELIEAAKRDEVLEPAGSVPEWLAHTGDPYLLNVAWFETRPTQHVYAAAMTGNRGVQVADCEEGGDCIGWIEDGDYVTYNDVDFGERCTEITLRASSASQGGTIEIRLDGPIGLPLGTCDIPNTGGWQRWQTFTVPIFPVEGTRSICFVFKARAEDTITTDLWFAEVNEETTTVWAQFPGVDPNEALVEVNVRRAVFYPDAPGINYLTVRGFTMRHAATQWAPPTAEQIGLIGTHWSKGWIIENNTISHSKCVGVTLGKYGDEYDNTSADTAEGYVLTINRALEKGWSRDNIGHHVVRNNHISHCEQAGIVGSLGAVFSTITGNTIHDIHVRRLFTGAEMAGIKIHAAIDTEISDNCIYRTIRGIWLDWMAQGTRVTRNLLFDSIGEDLFVEVDHGPFLVDNNCFLSGTNLLDMSEGGAYAHNLFAGRLIQRPELGRETPYHPAHTTAVAGLSTIVGGDDRFINNVFTGPEGLAGYDAVPLPMHVSGNVYLKGATPSDHETDALVLPEYNPEIALEQGENGITLHIALDSAWASAKERDLVTTQTLGEATIPKLPFVNPDDSPLRVDVDYLGKERDKNNPFPGPFETALPVINVWPKP